MYLIKLLKTNIFKNITSLSFNQGIQVLIQILFVPIYLTFWDLNTYSEWILISTIPALLSISQLGLTSYGSNLIVILTKQNKLNKANFTLQNIIYFTSLFVLIVASIILILNFFLNFQKTFNITSLDQTEFFFTLLFILGKYLILSNATFLCGLYRINHKFHISIYIKTFFVVTEIMLIGLVLILGGEILEVSFISFLNYLISLFFICILVKKEFKWLKIINFKNINLLFIKKIFYPSISFMTGGVNKGLIAQGTIIFLNYFSNDILIVFYNSLRLIINGTRQLLNIILNSFQPEITIDYAKKKMDKISFQLKSLLKYNFYLSTIFLIIIIMFIKEPFLIWTKNELPWDFNFFIIFIIANYIEWLGIPIVTVPYSINKAQIFNIFFIILLIIYFALLTLLYPSKQSLTVPIALMVANLYGLIHSWLILNKNINLNLTIK